MGPEGKNFKKGKRKKYRRSQPPMSFQRWHLRERTSKKGKRTKISKKEPTSDELLGAYEFLGAEVDVELEIFLLLRHHLKLVVERLQLVRHLSPHHHRDAM